MRRLGLVLLGLIVALGLASGARAATPAELWADAQRLMGYECKTPRMPFLCDVPRVVQKPMPEHYVGLFEFWLTDKVSVASNFPENSRMPRDSYIVHEYVHYLQWIQGKISPQATCIQALESEREAYRVQSAWLVEKTGFPFPQDRLDEILGEHALACAIPY